MRTIAIFVATTGGPAQIDRLTPEFAPQSMVCLKRGSTILPISSDYDDFVKRGSGVIEREFGPFEYASFRMDVTASIGAGKSWQLGVFAAHAVVADGEIKLAGIDASPDLVVWLTGEVDYDLGVGPVGHIVEKIASSQEFFSEWLELGVPVMAVLPNEKNIAELDHSQLPKNVEILGVNSTQELFASLGLKTRAKNEQLLPVISAPKKSSVANVSWLLSIFTFLILISLAWVFGPKVLQQVNAPPTKVGAGKNAIKNPNPKIPTTMKTVKPKLKVLGLDVFKLTIFERRPPPHSTCAKIHFGRIDAETQKIPKIRDGVLADSDAKNICGLKIEIDLGKNQHFVAVGLVAITDTFVSKVLAPKNLSGATKISGLHSWSINVPRRLTQPLSYRIFAIRGKEPVFAELKWFKEQRDWEQSSSNLRLKGFTILTWQHRILP